MSTEFASRHQVCCDANIVIRIVTNPNDRGARQLWSAWKDDGVIVVAPALIRFEVTNVIHRIATASGATTEEALLLLEDALALGVQTHDESYSHQRALVLSRQFKLAAAYDAHYLALAESLGCGFFTSDARLFRAVSSELAWVNLVQ